MDRRIKVLLPTDLHNKNEVDVLHSFRFRLVLLLARQSFLQLGSHYTMEPLFFLPWPL
jgi:hypothetical protein